MRQFAASLDVSIMMEEDWGIVHVCDFFRGDAPKGSGRQVLDRLHEYADEHGLAVELEHMDDLPKLGAYYQSFGYVAYDHAILDDGPGIIALRREPRSIQ